MEAVLGSTTFSKRSGPPTNEVTCVSAARFPVLPSAHRRVWIRPSPPAEARTSEMFSPRAVPSLLYLSAQCVFYPSAPAEAREERT